MLLLGNSDIQDRLIHTAHWRTSKTYNPKKHPNSWLRTLFLWVSVGQVPRPVPPGLPLSASEGTTIGGPGVQLDTCQVKGRPCKRQRYIEYRL